MGHKITLKVGESFGVFQNEFGCVSGVTNDSFFGAPTIRLHEDGTYYYFGYKMKCVGRLVIKSIKSTPTIAV